MTDELDDFFVFMESGRLLQVQSQYVPDDLVWQVTVLRQCGDDVRSRQTWRSPRFWTSNRADIACMMAHEVFSQPGKALAEGWRPVGGQPLRP